MPQALIALGSNLGDRQALLRRAIELLISPGDIRLLRTSRWRETQPIGGPADQSAFLNGAALVGTSLPPEELFSRLLDVEQTLGRDRAIRWGPRTIDLDLLLYDDQVQQRPTLTLPHPRMAFRRFVLEPAAEIAGEMVHPTIGWTLAQLLDHLNTAKPYVAVSGSHFAVTHRVVAAAAQQTAWRLLEFPGVGDETSPPGSPSLTLERAIEFLREQADLLTGVDWQAEPSGVITSFWIEDLLAISDVLWPGRLDETWHSLAASVVRPKLLAVCDVALESLSESDEAAALWRRLNKARLARASRPNLGPVLWLEVVDPAAASVELTAAIHAMA